MFPQLNLRYKFQYLSLHMTLNVKWQKQVSEFLSAVVLFP